MAAVLMVGFDSAIRLALEELSPELHLDMCQPEQADRLLKAHSYPLLLYNATEQCEPLLKTLSGMPPGTPVITALHPHFRKYAPRLVELGVSKILYHPMDLQALNRQVSRTLHLRTPKIGLYESSERPSQEVREFSSNLAIHGMTDAVGQVENLAQPLSKKSRLSSNDRTDVVENCNNPVELLEDPDVSGSVQTGSGHSSHTLIITSNDCDLCLELSKDGRGNRLRTLISRLDDFKISAALVPPDAVVIDLSDTQDEEYEAARQVLMSLDCPVVGLVDDIDLARRIELARSGVTFLFEKPIHSTQIIGQIQSLLTLPAFTRIVAIDDDPIFLASIESFLLRLESNLTSFSDSDGLWEALHVLGPDLIILNLDMPNVDGIGLCRAIRSDSRLAQLPIILITASVDPSVRQAAYDAGGDDVIAKDSGRTELRNRIVARLARNLASRKLLNDELTGLLTRAPAIEKIGDLLAQSRNRTLPTCLTILDLDHFKNINDRYGHLVGDRVLQSVASNLASEFRRQDVVSRWGGEEFVVVTFGMTKADTARRLTLVLERVTMVGHRSDDGPEFNVTFSGGVAEFPQDGHDLTALYKSADEALYEAKGEGRARVIPANRQDDRLRPETVDVMLVEHDHPLGSVLAEALKGVGLSSYWCRSGEEAILRSQTGLESRVIVIAHDLPGVTGLDVLQKMLALNLTGRAQILMVTANMSEEQVLQTFELGVADHISKPFFLPVMMRRIDRLLGRR